MIIDIGCGDNKRHPEAVGVDCRDYDAVDVVADIEEGLPFADGVADRVLAYSILEHVADLPEVMAEIHRVLKTGGVVFGKVPHYRDRNAYTDPTHCQYFTEETFDYWDSTKELGKLGYFGAEFRVVHAKRIVRAMIWRSRPIEFELIAG